MLVEFHEGYLICPADTEDWKQVEEKFRIRWNVTRWETYRYEEANEIWE